MEKLFIFSTVLLLLFILRVGYIRALCDDWNIQLDIYIKKIKEGGSETRLYKVSYLERCRLNPWKCWWKIHLYQIKHFVSDPFLIQDIHNQIQKRYTC